MTRICLLIVVLLLTLSCGFKPIYSSKNSSFEVIEILNKNKNKNSFEIEKIIMTLSNQEALKKVKLEIDYKQSIETILKDSKGDPSKKKLSIIVNLVVKSDNGNVLTNKSFGEEFNYVVQSDKFSMAQYEDNIVKNLNKKILLLRQFLQLIVRKVY